MALSPPLAVLGLVLAFAPVALGAWRGARTDERPGWPRIRRGLARTWGLALVVLLLVLVAGEPADLALDAPSVGTLVDGTLYGFIAFGGTMVAVGLALRASGGTVASAATLAVLEQPAHRKLAVAVTGAVAECLLLYGYVVETIAGFGFPPAVGGLLAAAGVVVGRVRWSAREAAQWIPGALVLAGVAVWARSLYVVVLIRLLYDSLTLLSGAPEDYAGDS